MYKRQEQQYIFDEADAWLDLWCHTVSEDPDNAFSFLAPIAQFGKFGAVLTLETLGQRWNWEKTKVWRFFQKHGDVFTLHRLPGAFGCLIFNKLYPTDAEVSIPESEKIERIIAEIRILAKNKQKVGSDQENLSRLVALYSRQLLTECAEEDENTMAQNRVALFDPYILRAYFSHSNCKKCIFDELETGDIIIFRRDGSYLVKRIAACAGDTIDHQNSIVTVPDNCYYVLGDNAENSHDSRYWADPYVSHEDVIAKLLMPIK